MRLEQHGHFRLSQAVLDQYEKDVGIAMEMEKNMIRKIRAEEAAEDEQALFHYAIPDPVDPDEDAHMAGAVVQTLVEQSSDGAVAALSDLYHPPYPTTCSTMVEFCIVDPVNDPNLLAAHDAMRHLEWTAGSPELARERLNAAVAAANMPIKLVPDHSGRQSTDSQDSDAEVEEDVAIPVDSNSEDVKVDAESGTGDVDLNNLRCHHRDGTPPAKRPRVGKSVKQRKKKTSSVEVHNGKS